MYYDQENQIQQPFPRILCTRRNFATAEIVDKGIALQETCGTRHAAEFLKRKMVSIDVTSRVLLQQSQRRNYAAAD